MLELYSLCASVSAIVHQFQVESVALRREWCDQLGERSRVSRLEPVPVVTTGSNGRPSMQAAEWGLIPPWESELPWEDELPSMERPTMVPMADENRILWQNTYPWGPWRCVLPATAVFVHMQHQEQLQPCVVRRRDGRLLALAGIFSTWWHSEGAVLPTCAVLTASQHDLPVEGQMPFLLADDAIPTWQALSPSRETYSKLPRSQPVDQLLISPINQLPVADSEAIRRLPTVRSPFSADNDMMLRCLAQAESSGATF
jgi:putative SOS response-associated peptidase YedK